MYKKIIILLAVVFLVIGCENKERTDTAFKENVEMNNEVESSNVYNSEANNTEETIETNTPVEPAASEQIEETPAIACTPKKFENKYTYVYNSKYECDHEGIDVYYDLDDNNIIENLSFYGCDEIVDECGDTYYGLRFTIWTGPGNDDYSTLYY